MIVQLSLPLCPESRLNKVMPSHWPSAFPSSSMWPEDHGWPSQTSQSPSWRCFPDHHLALLSSKFLLHPEAESDLCYLLLLLSSSTTDLGWAIKTILPPQYCWKWKINSGKQIWAKHFNEDMTSSILKRNEEGWMGQYLPTFCVGFLSQKACIIWLFSTRRVDLGCHAPGIE